MTSFGCESGSGGYNTLSYVVITPKNGSTINYTITIDKDTSFTFTTNIKTTINQEECEPYSTMCLIVNKKQIHSKKYYYENVLVEVSGDYTIEKKTWTHVDR